MILLFTALTVMIVVTVVTLIAFSYPEYYASLVKWICKPFIKIYRKLTGNKVVVKPRKQTPNEILAGKIEQLAPEKTLRYKVLEPRVWCCNFISVELNHCYPQLGKKYILNREMVLNGLPDGNKCFMYETDSAMEIANSIIERKGIPFATAEELLAGAEVTMVKNEKEKITI